MLLERKGEAMFGGKSFTHLFYFSGKNIILFLFFLCLFCDFQSAYK